jgi:predicted DNA-binding transcriptional regulator YafY
MSRSERLLQLMQLLREHHFPVSAETLAKHLQVSIRTIYRDIETLNAQGTNIVGEAGLGFQLQGGFFLPPMMWTDNEIEALILGANWVSHLPDEPLQQSAKAILAKLQAILPSKQQHLFEHTTLFAIDQWMPVNQQIVTGVRMATRHQFKIKIHYINELQKSAERIIWPITIGYFKDRMILAAWCELRQDFRHFRLDRIQCCDIIEEHYPKYKKQLFKQWWASYIATADKN